MLTWAGGREATRSMGESDIDRHGQRGTRPGYNEVGQRCSWREWVTTVFVVASIIGSAVAPNLLRHGSCDSYVLALGLFAAAAIAPARLVLLAAASFRASVAIS
jgi:hypothetical protein